MLRGPGPWAGQTAEVRSERTIDRILHRQGLLRARPRKRPKDSYQRLERPGPMQLWQMDIVGGIRLVSPVTGELREAKVSPRSTTTPATASSPASWSGRPAGPISLIKERSSPC